MWIALRGLDIEKIKISLSKANYFWVLAAMFFGLLAYWFRAIRWNILLEPLNYQISNSNALWTIAFGYLMNLTIPRSGEVARATALYGVEKVPIDKSFGTIILERVVDLVCMLGFLILTIIFKKNAILTFYYKSGITINSYYFIFALLALTIGVFLFFKFKNKFKHLPIVGKIIEILEGIFHGLTTIFKLKQNIRFLLLSIAIWISYYFAAYLVCFALPETSNFSPADGFFLIVVGTLGMMVPASGGIGAFHLAMKLGISALFLSMGNDPKIGGEVGLSYAFISHTMQLVIMLIMGLISIPMLTKSRNQALKNQEFKKV